MKKKVFFVMSTDDCSGAEIVNFRIIEGLKDKYDFFWVSKKGKINSFLDKKNIEWIEIKELNRTEIKRIIEKYKPDIIHATDFKASVICSLVNTKIPFVSHLHNNALWIKKVCINSLAFLFAGIRAKKILTVSESIGNEYIFSRLLKKKIVNMDNPVSRSEIITQINDEEEKLYDICCVGRLTEAKNPSRFIKIIADCCNRKKDIKAIWIGDGELRDEFESDIEKYKLKDNLLLLGYKSNPYEYMSKSKIFVLTSKWEGYGLVAFEALSLGLPCIVSNVGGLPRIVDTSCGRICETDDDFEKEILHILNDESTYNSKKKNAIEKSIKLDNIEEYMIKLDMIYKEILDSNV